MLGKYKHLLMESPRVGLLESPRVELGGGDRVLVLPSGSLRLNVIIILGKIQSSRCRCRKGYSG